MSPVKARLYQGVQMIGDMALVKLPEIEEAVRALPMWAAFTLGNALKIVPRLLPTIAPQVHAAISKATDEQIAEALNTALVVIHSILDEAQTVTEEPHGSGHDGATIEEPAATDAAAIHAA